MAPHSSTLAWKIPWMEEPGRLQSMESQKGQTHLATEHTHTSEPVKLLSRVRLFAMDCSLPGFSIHGISQARILEWVAIPFPGDLPDPGIKPRSPALQADALLSEPPGKPMCTHMKLSIPIVGNFKNLTEYPGAELNRDTGNLSSKSAGTSLGGPEAQQRPRALTLLATHKVTARICEAQPDSCSASS